MFSELRSTDRPRRRAVARRVIAAAAGALLIVATAHGSGDRRSSGGSARQSRNASSNANRSSNSNANANRNTNANANANANRNANVNRNVNVNNDVNVNRNVNVNNNVNVNRGYPAHGGVVAGEEGAVAVGVDAREVALEGLAGDVRLDQGGLLLALHEPVGDLGLQHEAEHGHDDDGHGQRRQHDAQLHRAPPEHPDLTHPLGGEALETTTQARQHGVPRRPGLRAGRPCTRRRAP